MPAKKKATTKKTTKKKIVKSKVKNLNLLPSKRGYLNEILTKPVCIAFLGRNSILTLNILTPGLPDFAIFFFF